MATKVKIKILAFPYYVEEPDPITGNDRNVEKMAYRNDEVELSDEDLARAKRFDAIFTDEKGDPTTGDDVSAETPPFDADSVDVQSAPPEVLAEWIRQKKPTVDEVVDEANEDPEIAERLLAAENLATGQQPRSTLVEKLNEIIQGA
jgi:hypothetical protein